MLPPELGGKESAIVDTLTVRRCKYGKHPARVTVLDAPYMVVECLDKFMWMQKPNDVEDFKTKTM